MRDHAQQVTRQRAWSDAALGTSRTSCTSCAPGTSCTSLHSGNDLPVPALPAPVDAIPESGSQFLAQVRVVLASADAIEMATVQRLFATTRYPVIRGLTLAVNLLGNGWVYLAIVAALYFSGSPKAWQMAGAALAATAGSHAIYAVVKRMIGRLRPFERDPSMLPLARVLDRYSFPSGHCMTLTAVLVPIVHGAPTFMPYALIALAVLAWCRIAAAHHYPSDVIAGICLGVAVATPFTIIMVPA